MQNESKQRRKIANVAFDAVRKARADHEIVKAIGIKTVGKSLVVRLPDFADLEAIILGKDLFGIPDHGRMIGDELECLVIGATRTNERRRIVLKLAHAVDVWPAIRRAIRIGAIYDEVRIQRFVSSNGEQNHRIAVGYVEEQSIEIHEDKEDDPAAQTYLTGQVVRAVVTRFDDEAERVYARFDGDIIRARDVRIAAIQDRDINKQRRNVFVAGALGRMKINPLTIPARLHEGDIVVVRILQSDPDGGIEVEYLERAGTTRELVGRDDAPTLPSIEDQGSLT